MPIQSTVLKMQMLIVNLSNENICRRTICNECLMSSKIPHIFNLVNQVHIVNQSEKKVAFKLRIGYVIKTDISIIVHVFFLYLWHNF